MRKAAWKCGSNYRLDWQKREKDCAPALMYPLTRPYWIGFPGGCGLIVSPGNLDAALLCPPCYFGRTFFRLRLPTGRMRGGSRDSGHEAVVQGIDRRLRHPEASRQITRHRAVTRLHLIEPRLQVTFLNAEQGRLDRRHCGAVLRP